MFRRARNPGAAAIRGAISLLKKARFSSIFEGSMLILVTMSGEPTVGGDAVSWTSSSKLSTVSSPPITSRACWRNPASASKDPSRFASVSQSDRIPNTPPSRSALTFVPR